MVLRGFHNLRLISFTAPREIMLWKTHTVPFPNDKNHLEKWRRDAVHLFRFKLMGVMARLVLAIPAAISAAPERLFSTAGNVMTEKRWQLMCGNMEELVYLHEVCPQVRGWEVVKKMRLEWFFWINETHYLQCRLWYLVFWLWDSIWIWLWLSPAISRFSFSPSTHTHTRIHIEF